MIRLIPVLLAAAATLGGCATAERTWTCRRSIGPQPMAAANMFGLAGALALAANPDYAAYQARVNACVAEASR